MHSIQRSPTVSSPWLSHNDVPIWRLVVPCEDGVTTDLANMSPEGAAELRSQYAMARYARLEGQWETALSSLLRCRSILKGEEARVGKLSYGMLLLWAEIPLAQMYQLRGSAEGSAQMLLKAVETWREIFDVVMPFLEDRALGLDSKLLSFLYTAEYECGCASGDSVIKAHAIRNYAARIIGRGTRVQDDAEHELCLLLSYDYFWCGSFENSLQWIQKANRLWKQVLPPAAYLRWEVCVLMKLQRFNEARGALDRLSSARVPANEVAIRAEEVRRWKLDCDLQMLKSSAAFGDLQEQIDLDEELPELQYALELSVTLNSNQGQTAQHRHTEATTPVEKIMDEMLTPDSTSVRSWLSVERFKTIDSHIFKLPEGPRAAFALDFRRFTDAFQRKQSDLAILQLNFCREILQTIKKCIEDEAYYSILASVDHLLADLYQFCENHLSWQIEKALEIRKELLDCIEHVAPSDKYMKQHYMSLVILTEYQGLPSPEDVSREQIVQKYASLMDMKKEQAECDMCFWLFFRDNCLWRKCQRLKNDVMPRWEHSGINHSLPYTHLMRCEVELLLDNVTFLMGEDGEEYNLETVKMLLENAKVILKDLIQRFEGQSSYKVWAHSMLEECYLKMCKCATDAGDHEGADRYQESADMERAFHWSLLSELGLHEFKKPSSIAVTNRSHLIQVEEHKMEQYYWVRFPSDAYLAFQKLYEIGHYAQDEGDWECAIFNLELCRDLLKGLKERFKNAEFDSSLAWVDLPLVQLHHMKTKNLKKSLDLRREVRDCLGSLSEVDLYVQLAVNTNLHAAIYHLGHSIYPSRMDEIMNGITKLVPKSKFEAEIKQLVAKRASGVLDMDEVGKLMMLKLENEECAGKRREFWEIFMLMQGPNDWEYYIVSTLLYWHFVQGDYETAFQDIIGLLKQVVDKHFPEDREKKEQNVVFEVECLMELKMFLDADLLLKQATKGKSFKNLSSHIQQSIQMCKRGISGLHVALFETSRNVALYCLRITGVTCQYLRRYEDAANLHAQCIRIIEAAKNERHQASQIITEHRGLPGWYDYFQIGVSYRKMFETRMRSNTERALRIHPHFSDVKLEEPSVDDMEFKTALFSFQQQMKLVVNPDFIARGNHEVLKLYAAMDESYFDYLLIKFGLKNPANKEQFDHGIADMNNVKLMEDENHMKAQCNLTSTEQSILEEVEANMIKHGRRTSLQFANSLYAMKGRYTESWINVLEGHKDVYSKLQRHYLNKMFLEALTTPDYNPELQPKIVDEYRWKAFLYAERQRSRVLLYQLGPQKLTSLVARQLWEFDTSDLHALKTIQDHVAALEKDSVFVEYNHLQEDAWIIYVVQGGRLSHYLLTLKSEMKHLEGKISDILFHLNNYGRTKKMKSYTYNNDKMNEDLQYLHDLLIKPIASHLCQMKVQHKLILAPTELLTQVPFAALRDRTRLDKEKYLVQRHTISLVPSLRALQRCNERLEVLRKLDSHEGQGAIVALGDPTYGRDGGKMALTPLSGTKTEVDDIARAFSKIPVVKLLGEDATAEKLLHWVENPLHKSSRQHIVHIGAHGRVDDHDERNSCLFLAKPSAVGPSSSMPRPTAGKRIVDELDMDDEENDEVGTINEEPMEILNDVSTRTIAEMKELHINREKEKGKGKDEGQGEEDSKLEKETGKGEEVPGEIPIEKLIEWAEKKIHEVKIPNWKIFVEYPELTTKSKEAPKTYGPHVCSVLALKDISNSKVPWRAELVVLSACHTSQGKATAEGLVNLARAFIIAGVPCGGLSVVCSRYFYIRIDEGILQSATTWKRCCLIHAFSNVEFD